MRYYAEECWTGLKTSSDQLEALLLQESWSESQLTSNPWRVRRLLTKLKELRVQAQHLDKNSAFRPAISQVVSVIEVPQRNFLRSICWRIVEEFSKASIILFWVHIMLCYFQVSRKGVSFAVDMRQWTPPRRQH